jgi:hypothetical protein
MDSEARPMSVVQVKSGVLFTIIAPGGFRMLSAIDQSCAKMGVDFVITSACDGAHSGPDDPHHRGEAYDVRSHDFTPEQKTELLANVMGILGWESFYGFLEAPGTETEHFHFQIKKGTTYP